MKKILFIIFCSSSLLLSSCSKIRESAGVNRKVIDEYSVIENPPLVIPPKYDLLPPDQMKAKKIDDTDSELAKKILFGLDESEIEIDNNSLLINEILKETEADEVDDNIRETINEEFAGQKSSINDEITFENEKELNEAIANTENKITNTDNQAKTKEKKKKRFFFF